MSTSAPAVADGRRPASHAHGLDPALRDDVLAALDAAAALCTDAMPSLRQVADFDAASQALRVSRDRVRSVIAGAQRDGAVPATKQDDVLRRLVDLSAGVERARADYQQQRLNDVSAALADLEDVTAPSQLLKVGASAIAKLDYQRTLVSSLRDGVWLTESCFVAGDPDWAAFIRQAGQEHPRPLVPRMAEYELARRRRPMRVTSVADLEVVHEALLEATHSEAYVAAPITVRGRVIGFLHSDQPGTTGVTDFDAELLGVFGKGFSFALERAVALQELEELRSRVGGFVDQLHGAVQPTPVEDTFGLDSHRATAPAAGSPRPGAPRLRVVGDDLPDGPLTRRELEVMQLIATGATNQRIAHTLVIAETTVKGHVKQILRKLGAANRAEAIARWHAADARG